MKRVFYLLSCFLLFSSNSFTSEFYSEYKSGAHPVLSTKSEIEKVFKPMDDYLEDETSKKLEKGVTRIFILRHTESVANKLGINAGRMDFPLSEKGREDAEKLGEKLAKQMRGLEFDAVYFSPLLRTHETYEAFNKGWKKERGQDLPLPKVSEGLIEGNNGKLEGMYKTEYDVIKKKETEALEKLTQFDDLFNYKNKEAGARYESLHDVWNRALPDLNKIASDHPGKNVLVISHVGVVRALIVGNAAAKDPPVTLNYRKFKSKNGSLLILKSNGQGVRIEAVSPFDYEK